MGGGGNVVFDGVVVCGFAGAMFPVGVRVVIVFLEVRRETIWTAVPEMNSC